MCKLVVRVDGCSMMGWGGYVSLGLLIVVMCK
jgi:hypothetical protein